MIAKEDLFRVAKELRLPLLTVRAGRLMWDHRGGVKHRKTIEQLVERMHALGWVRETHDTDYHEEGWSAKWTFIKLNVRVIVSLDMGSDVKKNYFAIEVGAFVPAGPYEEVEQV